MRIGISFAFIKPYTGIWVYFTNLLKHAVLIDKETEYFIFTRLGCESIKASNVKVINLSLPSLPGKRVFWANFFIPKLAQKYNIDILLHAYHYAPIISTKFKNIVIIYDLAPIKLPNLHPKSEVYYYRFFLKDVIQHADRIIVISEYIRKEILEYYNVPPGKLTLIYPGHEHIEPPNVGKEGGYVCTINAGAARKNFFTILRAMEEINCEARLNLVLLGRGSKKIFRTLKPKYRNFVIPHEPSSQEEFTKILAKAKVFVYSTLYEGFGLPPLEAMKCGVPVVVSNIPIMHEVVDDAGLYCAPLDYKEFARAIKILLQDNELRHKLKTKGYERIKRFSWQKSAENLINLFKTL